MGIGILIIAIGLAIGTATTQDIQLTDLEMAKAIEYNIDAEEMEELKKSMEPELFDGVLYFYESEKNNTEIDKVDTSIAPIEELYVKKGLNIRDKPGLHGKVVGVLSSRDKVPVYKEVDGWVYIKLDGQEGYVNKVFLQSNKPIISSNVKNAKTKGITANTTTTNRAGASVMADGTYQTEMTFNISFYTNLPQHNGGYSKTASGKLPAYGMVANNVLPIGTKIYLEGWGVVTVEDRGGKGFNSVNRLDLFIPPNNGESESQYIARLKKLGRQTVKGTILN